MAAVEQVALRSRDKSEVNRVGSHRPGASIPSKASEIHRQRHLQIAWCEEQYRRLVPFGYSEASSSRRDQRRTYAVGIKKQDMVRPSLTNRAPCTVRRYIRDRPTRLPKFSHHSRGLCETEFFHNRQGGPIRVLLLNPKCLIARRCLACVASRNS